MPWPRILFTNNVSLPWWSARALTMQQCERARDRLLLKMVLGSSLSDRVRRMFLKRMAHEPCKKYADGPSKLHSVQATAG
mmetsp:Transcript_11383/g.20282  ORF Transcript_11383/g.20282 Transcript_11383/m.20282 type:complete len:80 (-) Transcript_11383:274-513(-)